MQISANVIHTVNFMQGAVTIVFALALGESLKMFVTGHEETPIVWNRLPGLIAFLFVYVPFFQSMSQYFYLTYLNPETVRPFQPGFLVFDGVMFILQAACFFSMSRTLAPRHWRHFYSGVLALMIIDIVWAGVTYQRGIHVGDWIYIDIGILVLIGGTMWYEHDRKPSLRPVYILLVVVGVATALSYWLESDIYFP